MTQHHNSSLPDNPYPTRGSRDNRLVALEQLAEPLQSLAKDVAELIDQHHLDTATISLNGELDGTIQLKNVPESGISLEVNGSVGESGTIPSGTPYYAHYSGEFFWRPSPDSEDFVKSGDTVRAGQLVGWAMGESKDMSFGLRADQDGIIQLIAANATKVTQDKTLLYYIKELQ